MRSDEVLRHGAQHLRRLHDASVGFASGGEAWQSPTKVPAEVVCHNDFAPHNLEFRDGRIVGAIDFDFCSPGPRLGDIAYFATWIVPLGAVVPRDPPGMDEARRRVALILEAYEAAPLVDFDDVIPVAIVRLRGLAELSRSKADELASCGSLRSEAQVTGTTSRRLGRVDGTEPIDHLVYRSVLPATGYGLGKDHGGDDRHAAAFDEIAQHPAELGVGDRLVDRSRVEDDDRFTHGAIDARSLSARRLARRFAVSGAGFATSRSSR